MSRRMATLSLQRAQSAKTGKTDKNSDFSCCSHQKVVLAGLAGLVQLCPLKWIVACDAMTLFEGDQPARYPNNFHAPFECRYIVAFYMSSIFHVINSDISDYLKVATHR